MSLTHISSELINLIGVAASPLIVLITYQVFRTRGFAGMPDVEIQNKVLDISFETIHAQIEKHLHTSVLHFYGDHFILPRDSPFLISQCLFITIPALWNKFFRYIEILVNLVSKVPNFTKLLK